LLGRKIQKKTYSFVGLSGKKEKLLGGQRLEGEKKRVIGKERSGRGGQGIGAGQVKKKCLKK